jgi:hypothetical protein
LEALAQGIALWKGGNILFRLKACNPNDYALSGLVVMGHLVP